VTLVARLAMKMKLEHHIYLCDLSFRIQGNKNNNLKRNW
jgi:hypothetical protein